jgi:very-short-patch-repair endonuclease
MPWHQPPAKPVAPRAAAHAKDLRRSPTAPERRLRRHLRHRPPIEGTLFRRQVAIGPYVADFCYLGARIIVEVDGDQHGFDAARAYDAKRTGYLETEGFRVLRFTNRDVMVEIDIVLDTILAAPAPATPTPDPSPQGGGEMEA